MTRPRRLAALAAIVALAFSACSSQDASVSDLVEAMEDADLTAAQADCIGDGVTSANFTQDELNDVAEAETPEDFPGDTGERINQILEECRSGEGTSTTEGGEGTDSTESTESTTTTAG